MATSPRRSWVWRLTLCNTWSTNAAANDSFNPMRHWHVRSEPASLRITNLLVENTALLLHSRNVIKFPTMSAPLPSLARTYVMDSCPLNAPPPQSSGIPSKGASRTAPNTYNTSSGVPPREAPFRSISLGEAVVAKRQNWWAAFSTSVDRFLKESRTFRG